MESWLVDSKSKHTIWLELLLSRRGSNVRYVPVLYPYHADIGRVEHADPKGQSIEFSAQRQGQGAGHGIPPVSPIES